MPDPDPRPPKGGRPSLLSAEQQAEADRHRILSSLDAKPAAAKTAAPLPPSRNARLRWGAAGIGVIALAAGALAWNSAETEDKPALASAAPSKPIAPAAASAVPASAAAAASVPAAAEPEVSTAAILNDAPEAKLPSMKEMLSAPPAAGKAAPADAGALAQALEQPSPAAPVKKHPTEHKAEAAHLAQKPHVAEHKASPAQKAKHADAAPDSDVVLLAALMAHMQTPAGKKLDGPAAQLKQCKQQGAVSEAQCRTRLCAGVAKNEAECKPPPIAKASSDS